MNSIEILRCSVLLEYFKDSKKITLEKIENYISKFQNIIANSRNEDLAKELKDLKNRILSLYSPNNARAMNVVKSLAILSSSIFPNNECVHKQTSDTRNGLAGSLFPADIYRHILSFLSLKKSQKCSLVCKDFLKFSKEPLTLINIINRNRLPIMQIGLNSEEIKNLLKFYGEHLEYLDVEVSEVKGFETNTSLNVIKVKEFINFCPNLKAFKLIYENENDIKVLTELDNLKNIIEFDIVTKSECIKEINFEQFIQLKVLYATSNNRGEGFQNSISKLTNLEELHITYPYDNSRNGYDVNYIKKLSSTESLKKLKVLALNNLYFDDEGVEAITTSKYLTELTKLSINGSKITSEGVKKIAASENFKGLKELSLKDSCFSAKGTKEIITSNILTKLERLALSECNEAGEEDVTVFQVLALEENYTLSQLRILDLRDCFTENLKVLASSTNLVKLSCLYLPRDCYLLMQDGIRTFLFSTVLNPSAILKAFGEWYCSNQVKYRQDKLLKRAFRFIDEDPEQVLNIVRVLISFE